jgi:hypothetical protein
LSLPAIQGFLEESSSDVLLLLDTCETVLSSTVSGGTTVMELLASSGFNAKGKNRSRSFTRALIGELIDRATGPPFSTAELHVALLCGMKTRPPDDGERKPPPLYMVLTKPSQFRRGILLSPIKRAPSHPAIGESPDTMDLQNLDDVPPKENCLKIPQVQISIELEPNGPELDLKACTEWLSSIPFLAKNVKVKGEFHYYL